MAGSPYRPVAKTVFGTLSGPINEPVSVLDTNFTNIVNAIQDPLIASNVGVDTGGANAYVVAITPGPTVLDSTQVNLLVVFNPAVSNTGASTLNLNGFGAVAIQRGNGAALIGGEIIAGMPCIVAWQGATTKWSLVNPASGGTPVVLGGTPTAIGTLGYAASQLNVGDGAANHVVVDKDTVQTLTNKTLTSPAINTPTLIVASATPTAAGSLGYGSGGLNIGDGTINRPIGRDNASSNTAYTSTGSATLGATLVIPANSLNADGKAYRAEVFIDSNAGTVAATVQVRFDGNVLITETFAGPESGVGAYTVFVIRLSATTAVVYARLNHLVGSSAGSLGTLSTGSGTITVANWTATRTIDVNVSAWTSGTIRSIIIGEQLN